MQLKCESQYFTFCTCCIHMFNFFKKMYIYAKYCENHIIRTPFSMRYYLYA